MNWRSALLCWGLALALATLYVSTGPLGSAGPASAPMPVSPAAPIAGPPAYELSRDRVASVEVSRGDERVLWVPSGGGWRVEHPARANIPGGVLDAFVEQLVDGGASERLDGPPVTDTGLDHPALRIRVEEVGGGHLTLAIGGRTPTGTAVYGRVEETGTLFIAGLSFLTYTDLLFAALR